MKLNKTYILFSRLNFFKTLELIGSDNFEITKYGNLWIEGLIVDQSVEILKNNKIYFEFL